MDKRRDFTQPLAGVPDHVTAAIFALVNTLRFGLLLLGPDQSVVYNNRTAETYLRGRHSVRVRQGRLATDVPELTSLIGKRQSEIRTMDMVSISVTDKILPASRRFLLVSRLYLKRSQDPCVLLLHEPYRSNDLSLSSFARAYALTPCEAALVRHLALGKTLSETAADLDVSLNTARTHLKHVFVKFNVRTQADLIRQVSQGPFAITRTENLRSPPEP